MAVSIVKAENYEGKTIRRALRQACSLLGMDPDNPFRDIVSPGFRVFIKPNWVAHEYRRSCPCQHDVYTSITHPTVIAEVARLVDRALDGEGCITIGDNPSIDARFDQLMELMRLDYLAEELKTPVEILDLRPMYCHDLKDYGKKDKMTPLAGDPRGETVVDLGRDSLLHGVSARLFRGVFDQREETIWAHSGGRQLYSISNSIYEADVYISLPKLKCHHKVGTTLNLKGLVGTQGKKNYLVHWREGFPALGGDAYPSFFHWLRDRFRRVKKRGAWDGNDTIWRMVVDLYTILRKDGPSRHYSVIDGVLAGQRNGPFCPDPKDAQTLLMGDDLLETDLVASRLMGFNPAKITYLQYYLREKSVRLEDIAMRSADVELADFWDNSVRHLAFEPPTYWKSMMH